VSIATRYAAIGSQQALLRALGGYLRAYQLQAALFWSLRLVGGGLALDLLLLIGLRLRPAFELPGAALAFPPLLGLGLGAAIGLLRRPRVKWLAGEVDRRLGLHERTVTALELVRRPLSTHNPEPSSLVQEQIADSVHHLRQAAPLEAFPLRVPRREVIGVLVMAIALAPLVLLAPGSSAPRAASNPEQVARGEAERITAMAEEIERDEESPETAGTNQQVAEILRQVGDDLRDAAADADRAMAQLGSAERRLAQMQSQRAMDASAALSRVADAFDRAPQTQSIASALDRRDYKKAADELRQLGGKAAQGSEADRQAMAQALRQGAQAAQRYDEQLANALREAADRAQNGDQGATDNAAQEMSRAGSEMRRQETLERAMSQLQNSRQAVGNQGNPQSGQSGQGNRQQGQSAQGSQSGSQAGGRRDSDAGDGRGQGQGQGDRGDGQGQGQGQGQGDGQGDQPGSSAGTGSTGRTTDVYDPASVRTRQVQVPGGDFDRPQIQNGGNLADGGDGEVRVDYRDVLPTYQERATRAMQDRYIPLGMKELVKEYFSSLQPNGSR
jgi:hypothetical protein